MIDTIRETVPLMAPERIRLADVEGRTISGSGTTDVQGPIQTGSTAAFSDVDTSQFHLSPLQAWVWEANARAMRMFLVTHHLSDWESPSQPATDSEAWSAWSYRQLNRQAISDLPQAAWQDSTDDDIEFDGLRFNTIRAVEEHFRGDDADTAQAR